MLLALLFSCVWVSPTQLDDDILGGGLTLLPLDIEIGACGTPAFQVFGRTREDLAGQTVRLDVTLDETTVRTDTVVGRGGGLQWDVSGLAAVRDPGTTSTTLRLRAEGPDVLADTFAELSVVPVEPTFVDGDGDGFGAGDPVVDCLTGRVEAAGDCDDNDPRIAPGAAERCNLLDDDCDGEVDEGAAAILTYIDADDDGFGDALTAALGCEDDPSVVDVAGDCDDGDPERRPDAPELCGNGIDDDCDGQVEAPEVVYFEDADGDGFGNPARETLTCLGPPAGSVFNNADCDDGDAGIGPGAVETCDGVDQDCDGLVDEGLEQLFFPDMDGDGFGDPLAPRTACQAPVQHVSDATDCDDTLARSRPGGMEVCDGLDNDCDGEVDQDLDGVWDAAADMGWPALPEPLAAGQSLRICGEVDWDGVALAPDLTFEGAGPGATMMGSAFVQDGGLTLRGLTFTGGNGTIYPVGAGDVSFVGGGVLTGIDATVLIEDSLLRCGAQPALDRGGAIRMQGGAITLRSTAIEGCASLDGGGLYGFQTMVETLGTLDAPTTFSRNAAEVNGGGLNLQLGTWVTSEEPGAVVFRDNRAGVGGGAYVQPDANTSLTASFIANRAEGGVGGGLVYTAGTPGTLRLVGSDFANNSSTGSGGGLFASAGQELDLVDTTFFGNTATAQGGGVYAISALGGSITRGSFQQNQAGITGGGLQVSLSADQVFRTEDVDFRGNVSAFGGGISAVLASSGAVEGDAATLEVTSTDGQVGTFDSNLAVESGGAIRLAGVELRVNGSTAFTDNDAQYSSGGAVYSSWTGASLRTAPVRFEGGEVVFHGNVAREDGGAIAILHHPNQLDASGWTLIFDGPSTFAYNAARFDGAAIQVVQYDESIPAVRLNDATFYGNGGLSTSDAEVGTIYLNRGRLECSFCTFGLGDVDPVVVDEGPLVYAGTGDALLAPDLGAQPAVVTATALMCEAIAPGVVCTREP